MIVVILQATLVWPMKTLLLILIQNTWDLQVTASSSGVLQSIDPISVPRCQLLVQSRPREGLVRASNRHQQHCCGLDTKHRYNGYKVTAI